MSVDATKPSNIEVLSDYAEIIRDIATQVNTNEAAIGGDFTRTVEDKTATEALAVADLNKVFRVNSGMTDNFQLEYPVQK